MPESPRLSTLIGISRSEDRVWPLNAALFSFGALILWIVFRYLRADDPRWLYNPWFYVILTPVGLFLISLLLSALVSRLVERSVQLAFLLSVMVHLILLVLAVDFVIVSRLWPDVFENIQRQRVILKKQQEIPKYYNLAASSLGNRRPDYLRYVPTKHRPTEIRSTDSAMLQLARSEHAQLATPEPKHQSSAQSYMIEREEPALSLPQAAQQAAPLSRSQLKDQLEISRLIESIQPDVRQASPPEPLEAAQASVQRRLQKSDNKPPLDLNSVATEPLRNNRVEPITIARAERNDNLVPKASQGERPQRSRQFQSLLPTNQNIDIKLANAIDSSRPQPALAPHEPASRTKSSQTPTERELTAAPESPLTPRASKPNVERVAAKQQEIPLLSGGDSVDSPRTKTAGGQTGPAAALSMPVLGLQSVASQSTVPSIAPSMLSELASRKTPIERTNAQMPTIGSSQSVEWSQSIRFTDGTQGSASVTLADRANSGQAPKFDVAGLVGDDSPLARSAVGPVSTRSSVSLPAGIAVSDIEGIAGLILQNDQNSTDAPQKLAAQSAELVRSNKSESSVLSGNGPRSVSSPEFSSGTSPSAPSLSRADQVSNPATNFKSDARALDQLRPRMESFAETGQAGPASRQGKIENVPATASTQGQLANQISPAEAELGQRRSSSRSGQIILSVEAELGQGGVALDPSSRGPLLARNDDSTISRKLSEIESTRFSRRDVGGPLAAGLNVPVPKPAFQQRLDRLNDESRGNEALVGPQTEIAIERGLVFLAKNQRVDGSWRLQDFDTPVLIRSDTAAVGLSLLAFQGAGYTHKQFKYAQVVDKALKYLVDHQLPSGDLYIPQDPASDQNAWLYSHSIATLALCEAYGMTQDERLRGAAQKAVEFMVASQDPQRGGWRYRPGAGADTSVTGWFTMALKSAQLAGLEVPEKTFDRLKLFLDAGQVSKENPHLYRYNPFAPDTIEQRHGLQPTAVMTSVGLLMRLYFGWQRNQPEMIAGAEHLLDNPPQAGTRNKTLRDTYYWYYATQVLFHMGGDRWKKWHSHLHPILIDGQIQDGEFAGSWDPFLPTADLWARFGGRLYVTTMNLLSLEVNYRHLPLYEATAK